MPVQKKQRKAKSTLKANLGSAFRCRNQSGASEYVHGLSFRGAATATRQNKETFHKSKGHLKKRFSNKDFLNCGLCAPTFFVIEAKSRFSLGIEQDCYLTFNLGVCDRRFAYPVL